MDCCICGPMAFFFKPPRNSICSSCYEGAKGMIAFFDELDGDQDVGIPTSSPGLKHHISKGILHAFKQVKKMKEREEELNEKLSFLDGLVLALWDGIHTDIMVKPGTGAPIAAHRALLVSSLSHFLETLDDQKLSILVATPSVMVFLQKRINESELVRLLNHLVKASPSSEIYCVSIANNQIILEERMGPEIVGYGGLASFRARSSPIPNT